jgi:ATP adenylyltransferase
MDRLWAPWRISYIQAKREKGCLFCRAAKRTRAQDLVVFKTRSSMCIMNIFPYNNGHLMVAPLAHTGDLAGLSEEALCDLMRSVTRAQKLLDRVLKPHGYNIGINIGQEAGAGIPGHLHLHIVPRWRADTNFMPVTAGTKVISQSLEELYRRLSESL